MDFDWTEAYEERVNGAIPDIYIPCDKLDRSKYAKFLTNFLASRKNESYVMNLNAEWGAGKTYFLQRWFHEIKDAHPATYIDAWKNDFSEDPLLTVISAITETLESNCNVSAEKYKKATLKTGARLMKQLAPALFKGVLKTYTGVDADKVADEDDFNLDNFNDAAVKALEIGLSEHQEKIESLQMFKITISNWLKEVISSDSEGELKKPMFVFIDELDRCRPTYAIELLETVKHLFDIPDLIFVIATDTEQLQHAVKSVYGEGFDASRYLYRFFNRSFSLKKPDVLEFIKSQKVFYGYLSKELLATCDDNLTFSEETLVSSLAGMCESFDFDLRTVQQWLDQLWGCYNNEENRNKYAWFVTAVLLGMKLSDPLLFRELTRTYTGWKFNGRRDKEKYIFKFLNRGASQKNINISMSPMHITKVPGSTASYSMAFNGTQCYERSYSSDSKIIEVIYDYFSEPPKNTEFVKVVWDSTEDKHPIIEMAMHYCENEKGASKQGYIDLVEMASDLT